MIIPSPFPLLSLTPILPQIPRPLARLYAREPDRFLLPHSLLVGTVLFAHGPAAICGAARRPPAAGVVLGPRIRITRPPPLKRNVYPGRMVLLPRAPGAG